MSDPTWNIHIFLRPHTEPIALTYATTQYPTIWKNNVAQIDGQHQVEVIANVFGGLNATITLTPTLSYNPPTLVQILWSGSADDAPRLIATEQPTSMFLIGKVRAQSDPDPNNAYISFDIQQQYEKSRDSD